MCSTLRISLVNVQSAFLFIFEFVASLHTGQAVCTTLFRIGYISMHDVYSAVGLYPCEAYTL